jgi:hypothetical protein
LKNQLDFGIRAFELDIHPDPIGGLYSTPAMLKFAGVPAKLNNPELLKPGYKVLHVPDIDFSTTCLTLFECLTAIKQWSDQHPDHVPITILLQPSFGETDLVELLGATGKSFVETQLAVSQIEGPTKLTVQPEASKELLGSIESEILSVFPQNQIITPDSVRTALNLPPTADLTKTLLQPPTATFCPWPDLESLRGKVMFGLIFPPGSETTAELYKSLHPGQKGAVAWMVWDGFYIPEAVMYTAGGGLSLSSAGGVVPPTMPQNASAIVDSLSKDIADKLKSGYLVRGRADADTIEARLGYVGRSSAVLNSGANIVSTDYAMPTSVLPGINYSVKLYGNKPARCVNNAALGTNYAEAEVSCEGTSLVTAMPLSSSSGGSNVATNETSSNTISSPMIEKTTSPSPGASSSEQPESVGGDGGSSSSGSGSSAASPLASSAGVTTNFTFWIVSVASVALISVLLV